MKLLGFAGAKQSGKSSAQNFVCGVILQSLMDEGGNKLVESVNMTEDGKLLIPGEDNELGILDFFVSDQNTQEWLENYLYPYVRPMNFADPIKRICHTMYGFPLEKLYGSDEDKNTPTNVKWGDLGLKLPKGKTKDDFMTIRDVMQNRGETDRVLSGGDCWCKIFDINSKSSNSERIIAADVRHDNEVQLIQSNGGVVIQFTKRVDEDAHESENGLVTSECNLRIDNQNMTMAECHEQILKYLESIRFFDAS